MGTETTVIPSTYTVDESTLTMTNKQLSVKALGIDSAQIAADAVTAAKINVVGLDGTSGKVNTINLTNFTNLNGISTQRVTMASGAAFTPTSASHIIYIIAKADVQTGNAADTVTLVDSVAGTLDTIVHGGGIDYQNGRFPCTMSYIGTLSAAAHTITITSAKTVANGVITIIEFAPA